MVCDRCRMMVKAEFDKLGIEPVSIELGEIIVENELDESTLSRLKTKFESIGFVWMNDKNSQKTNRIKSLIIELVHQGKDNLKVNLSDFIVEKTGEDYTSISKQFAEIEGITIEKYFINQRIEKVKELLMYDELNLSEIAFKLNFSSVAHLSNQFKQVVGQTATAFKNDSSKKRKELDTI